MATATPTRRQAAGPAKTIAATSAFPYSEVRYAAGSFWFSQDGVLSIATLSSSALARTRSKRRPRGERARAHAEARAERRRHVAQHVTAARAAAVVNDRAGSVGAQPVAAQIALCIDALNGEPGQILHDLFPSAAFSGHPTASKAPFPPKARRWRELWPGPPVVSRENATRCRGTLAGGGKPLQKAACRRAGSAVPRAPLPESSWRIRPARPRKIPCLSRVVEDRGQPSHFAFG
jgi:hypothetical protein